ncbi:MAG TPA: hydroxyacylglutathione hydrolase C-terminal domain-containing protein, partial [Novosphingobium sp.]|nr:hydroxyacylglutathione hydrolase C-terminal domain-containing protein [Novosphingobium sp.]
GGVWERRAPRFGPRLPLTGPPPADTLLYCAHEYTQGNARFAVHADPDNAELEAYAEAIDRARSEGRATVPFPLARDLRTNPFLRADDPALQARWGGGDAVETFAALREALGESKRPLHYL